MLLFRLSNLSLAFGDHPLIDKADLTIHKGERIGILGQNGAGKSTFMKLLNGQILPDTGELWRAQEIRVAYLDQSLPEQSDESVYDFVAGGLEGLGDLLRRYHALTHGDDIDWSDEKHLNEMGQLQKEIEERDGWAFEHKIETVIDVLQLSADAKMRTLSGGNRRRAALGRALLSEPDLLMLDEPTNHLDIPTIEWLEKYLNTFNGAILVITHDREFLKKITNRIIEIDRGNLRCWDYDYQSFLEFRDQQLDAESKANSEFDKKLAEEEKWIRKGIQARRTRNEGRVRALKKMREERSQRRELTGKAKFAVEQAGSSGKIVIEAKHVTHGFGDEMLIKDLSTKILRGDRVGFIGANGSGKTTLLKILLGDLKPLSGDVKIGTNLEIIYFDQLRNQLELEKTVIDNLAEGRDFIEINGKQRHVISYLQDFLFPPKRARQPVKSLSGGEQNRLILAKLFSKPANLIVLDEPTNDLDMETLELLEEILLDFSGTILLVSHDRKFMDNVITNCIVFERPGVIREYVGGYQDWVDQGGKLLSFADQAAEAKVLKDKAQNAASKDKAKPTSATPKQPSEPAAPAGTPAGTHTATLATTLATTLAATPANTKARPSFKQQRELDQVTKDIEKTEAQIKALENTMAEPGFFEQDQQLVQKKTGELNQLQEQLEALYARWGELDGL
jgi:ATP-binding cassette subfamily F protein uup